mgnify:CR=1 FL=1
MVGPVQSVAALEYVLVSQGMMETTVKIILMTVQQLFVKMVVHVRMVLTLTHALVQLITKGLTARHPRTLVRRPHARMMGHALFLAILAHVLVNLGSPVQAAKQT